MLHVIRLIQSNVWELNLLCSVAGNSKYLLRDDRKMEKLWAFVVIGGPIILGVVLLWASTHNRMSRKQKDASDAAVRPVRREAAEENRRE